MLLWPKATNISKRVCVRMYYVCRGMLVTTQSNLVANYLTSTTTPQLENGRKLYWGFHICTAQTNQKMCRSRTTMNDIDSCNLSFLTNLQFGKNMGLADFDFLPSVPQTFWGFPPFLSPRIFYWFLRVSHWGFLDLYPNDPTYGGGLEDPELAIIRVHLNNTIFQSKGLLVTTRILVLA